LLGKIYPYLCNPKLKKAIIVLIVFTIREFSSVGLEHLPYKQRVTGSTPVTPTKASQKCEAFLCEKVQLGLFGASQFLIKIVLKFG
jgi:hypothetical protein